MIKLQIELKIGLLSELQYVIFAGLGLVWFLCFNGISTFVGYLIPKLSF